MIKSILTKYGEIIRYLLIGVLTTIVNLASYYLLTFTILNPEDPIKLQIANVISWIISVIFAYFTNRSFVFQVKDKHTFSEFIKFVSSRVFTLLVDMSIMFVFVSLLHLDDKIFKLITQIIVIILNYLLSKFIVFAKSKTPPNTTPSDPKQA